MAQKSLQNFRNEGMTSSNISPPSPEASVGMCSGDGNLFEHLKDLVAVIEAIVQVPRENTVRRMATAIKI